MFRKAAATWRKENPNAKDNIRDGSALEQLVLLSNLESINAMLIHQQVSQADRLST